MKFLDYLSKLLKKSVLWLFLVLDAIGLGIVYFGNISISPYWFALLPIIGIIWSSYQIHSSTILYHARELSNLERAIDDLTVELREDVGEVPQNRSHVEVYASLVPGQEYRFLLSDPKNSRGARFAILEGKNIEGQYYLPDTSVFLNVRIDNVGKSTQLLNMDFRIQDFRGCFEFYGTNAIYSNEEELSYPIDFASNSHHEFTLKNRVDLEGTAIAFAQSLRAILGENRLETAGKGTIQYADEEFQVREIDIEFNVSIRPLVDQIIDQWKQYDQDHLIKLAGLA